MYKKYFVSVLVFGMMFAGAILPFAQAGKVENPQPNYSFALDHNLGNNNYTSSQNIHEGYIFSWEPSPIDINAYLYFVSNHSTIHYYYQRWEDTFILMSGFAEISLPAPSVASSQVVRIVIHLYINEAVLCGGKDQPMPMASEYRYSDPFMINPIPVPSISSLTVSTPEANDNYTIGADLNINLHGLGTVLDAPGWTLKYDIWAYFIENSTMAHFKNATAAIGYGGESYNGGGNLDTEAMDPGVMRIIVRVVLYQDSLFKVGNSITKTDPVLPFSPVRVIWGSSGPFSLNAELVAIIFTPENNDNLTVVFDIEWGSMGGYLPVTYTVFFTPDNGTTWLILEDNISAESITDFDSGVEATTYYCHIYVIVYDDVGSYSDADSGNFTIYIEGTEPITPPPAYTPPHNEYLAGSVPDETPDTPLNIPIEMWLMIIGLAIFIIGCAVASLRRR